VQVSVEPLLQVQAQLVTHADVEVTPPQPTLTAASTAPVIAIHKIKKAGFILINKRYFVK
jgi:hypothetical protein